MVCLWLDKCLVISKKWWLYLTSPARQPPNSSTIGDHILVLVPTLHYSFLSSSYSAIDGELPCFVIRTIEKKAQISQKPCFIYGFSLGHASMQFLLNNFMTQLRVLGTLVILVRDTPAIPSRIHAKLSWSTELANIFKLS